MGSERQLLDAAIALLKEVQWSDWDDTLGSCCPWCSHKEESGHRADCRLVILVGLASGTPGGGARAADRGEGRGAASDAQDGE